MRYVIGMTGLMVFLAWDMTKNGGYYLQAVGLEVHRLLQLLGL